MVEGLGGGGDICVGSSEEGGRFSDPLPFERAAAALAAILFALAFRLATPPRAFLTGFSAEGFSLRYNSLSRYPSHEFTEFPWTIRLLSSSIRFPYSISSSGSKFSRRSCSTVM